MSDPKKLEALCFHLNALRVATIPAAQALRRTAKDISALADMAEVMSALSEQLLSDLGQPPQPRARPELRAVPSPGKDGS